MFKMRSLHYILQCQLVGQSVEQYTILRKLGSYWRTSCTREDFRGLDMCGGCQPTVPRGKVCSHGADKWKEETELEHHCTGVTCLTEDRGNPGHAE